MITVLDFENADIGRLAVHLAEAWRPHPAQALPVLTSAAPFTAYTGYGVLLGVSFADTSAAANTVSIFDGAAGTDPLLATLSTGASLADVRWFGVPGIRVERGLTVASTGAGSAVLYLARHVRHD